MAAIIPAIGQVLVLSMTAYGATLAFSLTVDQPWGKREIVFPLYEWAALFGSLLGLAAAISIWFGVGLNQ